MKIRTLLSIMLIGMISLTAFATTSKLEPKPKATFIPDQKVCIEIVNVATVDFVFYEINTKVQSLANAYFTLKSEIKLLTIVATIDDVGWKVSEQNYNNYFKSNLPGTNRIPFVSLCNKTKARIRSDC